MEQDVEDGQVFTFSVHYSNIVDSDKTPTIGPTLVIDREKGKIEPSPLLRKGRRPTKSRRAPEPPQKVPDIDTLNNNASPVVQANGGPPSELPATCLTNGDLYKELPEHQSLHDGTVQSLGLTNHILPQQGPAFYRNRVSSLSAHEVALDLSDQRNSCTVPLTPQTNGKKRHHSTPALVSGRTRLTSTSSVPVANGKQRHSSALERRPAVVGDGSLALCETPGTPNKLPLVARKMTVGRTFCISLLVVLVVLLLIIIFAPLAWVLDRDNDGGTDTGVIIGANVTQGITETAYTTQGLPEYTSIRDGILSTAAPTSNPDTDLSSTHNGIADEQTTSRRTTVILQPDETTALPLDQSGQTTQTRSSTQAVTTGESRTAAPAITSDSPAARTSVAEDGDGGPGSTVNPGISVSGPHTVGLGGSSSSENITPNMSSFALPEGQGITPSDATTSAHSDDDVTSQTANPGVFDNPSTSETVTSSGPDQSTGNFDISTAGFTDSSDSNFR